MKNYISFLLIVFSVSSFAQDKNKLIVDESSGKQMLLGICNRTAFTDTNFAWWFNPEYNNYDVDSVFLKQAGNKLNDFVITVVMGSWCSDSRREMPRLLKILDKLNYNQQRLRLICVNRKREWPDGNIENLEIKLVPSIIFYEMGIEKGRIVESPKETLEKDMLNFILK